MNARIGKSHVMSAIVAVMATALTSCAHADSTVTASKEYVNRKVAAALDSVGVAMEDQWRATTNVISASSASATNYVDSATNDVLVAAQGYTDEKISEIPAADFSTNNVELVETIEATAPPPGDYAAVSNAAVHAAITNALQDAAITTLVSSVSAVANAATNYVDSATNDVLMAAQGYTDEKISEIPAADFSTNNVELVETIEATAPPPGDYAAVSNAAVYAAITNALQDAALAGKLDKSGGTVTGQITVKHSGIPPLGIDEQGFKAVYDRSGVGGSVTVYAPGVIRNNKNSLILPETAGTLALLSDTYTLIQQIAPNFMGDAYYALHDLCSYNGVVYQCVLAYTATPSGPTPDGDTTHWEAKKFSELFLPLTGGRLSGNLQINDGIAVGTVLGSPGLFMRAIEGADFIVFSQANIMRNGHITFYYPRSSGTLAIAAPDPTAGNLAALDVDGNPTDSGVAKSDVESLFFAQYYPDGSVKSATEFRSDIKYNLDTTNHTATVKPFCFTGTAANDNSSLVGRVVIPPFVDGNGNPHISDDGTRFKVVGVSGGTPNGGNFMLAAIVAPNTVTSIGNNAFAYCAALTSVSFPAATGIGNSAFHTCEELSSISLPAATDIGEYAFYNCPALASVSLPAAISIGSLAFSRCHSLTSVDFGDTPRPSVSSLGENAFDSVPTSCKIIVPDTQYDAWTAASGWSDLVTAGYRFLRHSEWEYARKYETVPTSRTVNGNALTNDVTLTGADIPVNATAGAQKIDAALAGKASKADATLTPIYSQTPTFSEWTFDRSGVSISTPFEVSEGVWVYSIAVDGINNVSDQMFSSEAEALVATRLTTTTTFGDQITATRTRTDIIGYRLGPDEQTNPNRDKPLASEAEAEALRTEVAGKLDKMKPVAWSELKTLRDGGSLVPGQQYRITNYVATTSGDMDSQSANHPFDIIVVADSTTNLNEHARAAIHAGNSYFASCNLAAWDVWYCIDNDTSRFAWAVANGGKGVIYRLVDEFQNDVPYDFKGIQFKAYGDTDNVWRYTFDSGDASGNTDCSLHGGTSGTVQNWVFSNKILPYYEDAMGVRLNRIVLKGSNCYNNKFDLNCYNNKFGSYCYNNTFGSNCNNNTFGLDCASNTFGSYCNNNTFGSDCNDNTFGSNCNNNTFGSDCAFNTFGLDCASNTFGSYCNNNTFGANSYVGSWHIYSPKYVGTAVRYDNVLRTVQKQYRATFLTSQTYLVGETLYYQSKYWECTTEHMGTWDEAHFTEIQLVGGILSADEYVPRSYYRYVELEDGVSYVALDCTTDRDNGVCYQNVTVSKGVTGTESAPKHIEDANFNQSFKTTYQPANSQVIEVQ